MSEKHRLVHVLANQMIKEKHNFPGTDDQEAIKKLSSESHQLVELIKQLRQKSITVLSPARG